MQRIVRSWIARDECEEFAGGYREGRGSVRSQPNDTATCCPNRVREAPRWPASTVLHHFGAPRDAALAGTLVYRAISALLPAAAGALLLSVAWFASASTPPETRCGEGEPLTMSRWIRTVRRDTSGGKPSRQMLDFFRLRPGIDGAWCRRRQPCRRPGLSHLAGSGVGGGLDAVRGAITTSQGPRRLRSSARLRRTTRRRRSARRHGTTTMSASCSRRGLGEDLAFGSACGEIVDGWRVTDGLCGL